MISAARMASGLSFEDEFKDLIASRVSQYPWSLKQSGQGAQTERVRAKMQANQFPGSQKFVRELIESTLDPADAAIYLSHYRNGIPDLMRWQPDFRLRYGDRLVCAVEIKGTVSQSPNWAIEISSILGISMYLKTGTNCIFAFCPSDAGFRCWTCATLDQVMKHHFAAHDGSMTKGGSGTPFLLVKKSEINTPVTSLLSLIEDGCRAPFSMNSLKP